KKTSRARATKEGLPQLPPQLAYGRADGGLAPMQFLPGPREAPFLHDRHKGLELEKVHSGTCTAYGAIRETYTSTRAYDSITIISLDYDGSGLENSCFVLRHGG